MRWYLNLLQPKESDIMSDIHIKRALISVSDKTGIVQLAARLAGQGVELISTGGTANLLREHGLSVQDVSDITHYPEMMDGRVKTLHPNIHGGILALRGNADHQAAMHAHGIAPIDLVVVNLYPFEATIAKEALWEEVIENIDIGGPAMIRAAAKNHDHVVVVTDAGDYDLVSAVMSQAQSRALAAKAFARTAAYDAVVAGWLAPRVQANPWPAHLLDADLKQTLRYGENPHQQAAFYAKRTLAPCMAQATQLQGKELSYNNIQDTDAAFKLVAECEQPAVAIIKHANPCGVAIGATLTDAFIKALACDSVSAYGGILAVNRELDRTFVEALGSLFLEVIIAPSISDDAQALLATRKNLRVMITQGMPQKSAPSWMIKSISGGYLVQTENDRVLGDDALKTVTKIAPTAQQLSDLHFAFSVCKHVKSNAIIIAKDGATIGIGAGQMSRVDSVRLAQDKARAAGLSTQGAVLASDAFFPFDDNVHLAASAGIAALIQPGGSIRDDEVIAAADQHAMAMVFTGIRHFNH